MEHYSMAPLDVIIIGIYVLFVVGIGIYFARKHEDAEDYFLAGRSMTWPLIGASLYASNISSTTLVGLSGSAYGTGISVFNYEWMAAVVLVFFAVFVLPFYLRSKLYTMPQFLEVRYDGRSRTYFSLITLIGNVIIDTSASLYSGALLIKMMWPELPMWQTVSILALLAGGYTVMGGLKAVIITDAVQAVLLQIGAIVIAVVAFIKIGGNFDAVREVTGPEMLSLIRPASDPTMPWTGLVLGVPLLGFYYWCTNQYMVQRVLSAKSTQHGRLGALFAGSLKLPVLFIMVLPGAMARVLYPNLQNADMVYPTMMFDMLPVGLLGLVMAGFFAALMSQLDSTLNAASTLVTMDFVKRWKPEMTSEKLMKVGRWVTFVFMIFAAAWAPQITKFGGLFQYLQNVLSYLTPPVIAVFLLGLFWKRANAQGAFVSLISGLVISIFFLVGNVTGFLPQIHFLHVAFILTVFSGAIHVVVSLMTAPPPSEKIEGTIWSKVFFKKETEELKGIPWYYNYRIISVILLVSTAVLVAWWW